MKFCTETLILIWTTKGHLPLIHWTIQWEIQKILTGLFHFAFLTNQVVQSEKHTMGMCYDIF